MAELLEQVVLRAEDVGGVDRALEHQANAIERQPHEVELDLEAIEERLEAVNGGVVRAVPPTR